MIFCFYVNGPTMQSNMTTGLLFVFLGFCTYVIERSTSGNWTVYFHSVLQQHQVSKAILRSWFTVCLTLLRKHVINTSTR